MKHETRREFFKDAPVITKIIYCLGCVKLCKNYYTYGRMNRYGIKIRVVHPLSWPIILIMLIVNGLNHESINDMKSALVLW